MKQETITTICNKALSLLGEEPITSYDNDTSLAGRACRAHFDLVMATLLEEGFWTFPTVEKELEKLTESIEEEVTRTIEIPYFLGMTQGSPKYYRYEEGDVEGAEAPYAWRAENTTQTYYTKVLSASSGVHYSYTNSTAGTIYIQIMSFGTEEQTITETVTTEKDIKFGEFFLYKIPENCVLIHSIYPEGGRHDENIPLDWDIRYFPEETERYIISKIDSKDRPLFCEYLFSPDNLEIYSASFLKALVDGIAYSICMEVTKDLQRTQFLLQLYEKDKADALRKAMNEDLSEHEYTSPFVSCRG